MKVEVKDLTKGSPWRLMVAFAMPLILSQLFQQLYSTADSLIVGKFLGTASLAAVTSAYPMVHLLVEFFTGLSVGAGIIISKYIGAGDYEKVKRSIHTDVLFGLISGIALSITGVLLAPHFLRWMKVDSNVYELALNYYTFYFAGSIAVVMYNILLGIMNSLGNSKKPLYFLIVSSLLNIVLDIVFIRFMGFGVGSAAIATVISQLFSVCLCLAHLCKKGQIYSLSFKNLAIDKKLFKEMFRIGMPSAITYSVIGFANVIVQSSINSFGMKATAAFGAHTKIEGFGFLPITSFTMAISTFISQNLGAKQYDRAKKGARFGILSCCIMAELIGVILFVLRKPMIAIFDSDPSVIEIGARAEEIMALFYCLLAFSHAVSAVCRGAGKAFVPMFIMLFVWCAFRIAYITTVMHIFNNLDFVFWAYPLTWTISSIIYFIYYKTSDWVHGFDKS